MTARPATTGTATARTETNTDPPASAVETAGLPAPPVVALDAPRATTVIPCTIPAAPPPATTASVQVRSGLAPDTHAAIATVPAITAAGVATESRALSSHGTR